MNKASCDGVTLDVDSYDYGPETVTWGDAANDPYMYKIWVNDYDDLGVGQSGAKITLFGETNINMEAEAGHSGRQALQIFVKAQHCFLHLDISQVQMALAAVTSDLLQLMGDRQLQ